LRASNRPWHLGNTTVRSPFRLASALKVLLDSRYNGHLSSAKAEAGFGQLLFTEGLLRSVSDGEIGAWNGRKWRSAMYQLGFITPALTSGLPQESIDPRILSIGGGLPEIDGLQFKVTASGKRLALSTSIAQMEECFLRAILAYRVPSAIERTHASVPFSPLRIVLKTILALEQTGLQAAVSFEEMASLVQFCKSEAGVSRLVGDIASYRAERAAAANKRAFDRSFRERLLAEHGNPVKSTSLDDYADVNFRYLRATGLVTRARAALCVTEEKRREVEVIVTPEDRRLEDDAYLRRLWVGEVLPTDDAGEAASAIRRLARNLTEAGRAVDVPVVEGMQVAELEQIRLKLEMEHRMVREEQFAVAQGAETAAINDLLLLMDRKDDRAAFYRGEAPAYLEWAVWRAFLAIDTLANEPWQVRQFHIDADMSPIAPASSRRPDMICEFADFVLVVEVTFTENSRQEAAEGEPVRRHVAEVTRNNPVKPVYGLFIAPRIDTNTAETFGRGDFVLSEERILLSIVPLTLAQFAGVFQAGFDGPRAVGPAGIRQLLDAALAARDRDGGRWKAAIANVVSEFITSLAMSRASA